MIKQTTSNNIIINLLKINNTNNKLSSSLMIRHNEILDSELHKQLKSGEIKFGGNIKLKIYGTLTCSSGKRMKRENRVFFKNIEDAIYIGFRPCGNCMKKEYKIWKEGINK